MPSKGKGRASASAKGGPKRKRGALGAGGNASASAALEEEEEEEGGGVGEGDRLSSKWDEEKMAKKAKKEAEMQRLDEKELLYDEEDGNYQEEASAEAVNEAGDAIIPFNLKGDEEEGFYDAGGTFVWRKDKDAVVQEDAWLEDNASEASLQATRAAREAREQAEDEAATAAEQAEDEAEGATALEARLHRLLRPGESVARALQRLGPQKIAPGGGRKARRMVLTGQAKADFDAVASAADRLLAAGSMDVYQAKRESFARAAARESAAAELAAEREAEAAAAAAGGGGSSDDSAVAAQWEYKSADGVLQGPFSTGQVLAWRAQGYFTGATAVQMRRVVAGAPSKVAVATVPQKAAADDLLNDLDDDDDDDMPEESAEQDVTTAWACSDDIDFSKYQP